MSSERYPDSDRFRELLTDPTYIALKNHLYNYRCRRNAIGDVLSGRSPGLMLEVGSGLSPILIDTPDIVYSELSFEGLKNLRALHGKGHYVQADATRLPFREQGFAHVICSEVLEHVEDDSRAIAEMGRIVKDDGSVIITVPHGPFYFSSDDRFVSHFRRYTCADMESKLADAGLTLQEFRKVLGPFEKVVMWPCVFAFRILNTVGLVGGENGNEASSKPPWWVRALLPFWRAANAIATPIARADAAIMPKRLATVVLFRATR